MKNQWKEIKKTNLYFFSLEIKSNLDDNQLSNVFSELWIKLTDDALPLNKDVYWDAIRVEFWIDSGRIIVFPFSLQINERIEKAGCQIIFLDLLQYWEKLEKGNISDEEFTQLIIEKRNEYANKLLKMAYDLKINEKLYLNTSSNTVKLYFCNSDEEEPFLSTKI